MDPVLLVTPHVPPDRLAPFAALHARVGIEVARYGGRTHHATAADQDGALPFPVGDVTQREVLGLAAAGGHRAVIAGTAGRVALPAAWAGARRARVPFVLWTALWRHPRTLAHLLSWPLLATLYRRADAVATYGPHVSAHARRRGAQRVVEAPQPVDVGFWSAPPTAERRAPYVVAFVGRPQPEKGIGVLLEAWRVSGLGAPEAALVLVGGDGPPVPPPTAGAAILRHGRRSPEEVRNLLGAADVLVVPSVPTRSFLEPWGLVVNEGMLQGTAIIASDAVGAAAGGLVRDGETGRVVPAGDAEALARVLLELRDDPAQRRRLAAAGREEARRFTPEAWAEGMVHALALAGVEGVRC